MHHSRPPGARRPRALVASAAATLAVVAVLVGSGVAPASALPLPPSPTGNPSESTVAPSPMPSPSDAPRTPSPAASPSASATIAAPTPGADRPLPSPAPYDDDDTVDVPSTPSPDGGETPDPPAESSPGDEADPPGDADSTPGPEARDGADTGMPAQRAPPSARIDALAAGVPEAPATVWTESFEQGLTPTTLTSITGYATGRFTASTGWASGSTCTGVVLAYAAPYPNAQVCPNQGIVSNSSLSAREVRRLADVLGQLGAGVAGSTAAGTPASGSTDATRGNHAVVALPYTTVAGGTTLAQSTAGIGVSATASRYYTVRFDAAAAACSANTPALSAGLFSGTTTLLSAFPTAVNPCAATGPVFYTSTPVLAPGGSIGGILDPTISTSARATTYTGTAAALLTPAQISAAQVRLTNTTTGAGSAFGIDNLRVLDATPRLDLSFSPASVAVGSTSTLTYTVTNTSEGAAKNDWSFTNTLPAGLTVAPTPAIGGTCTQVTGTAFVVTALAGGSSIAAVGGDLPAGSANTSCTITVNVVASVEGTYTNGPGNVVTPLIATEATTLAVTPATRLTLRKNLPARGASTDQFTLSIRTSAATLATTTTTGNSSGVQSAQISRLIVNPGGTYTISESPTSGTGLGYAASYDCTRDGTVVATGTSRSGTIRMPDDAGAEIVCTFTNTLQQTRLACDSGLFYGLTVTGALVQGDIVGGGQTTVGTWPNVAAANSLGISAGGTTAYALNRSTDGANVLSILKWTPSGGFETLAGTAYTTAGPGGTAVAGSIVTGAVDLSTGRYLFGKFTNGAFHLWSFTESAPTASRFAYLGSFSAGTAPNGNGDMAFDSRGNLYVLGAATVNNASSAAIFTVTTETLAAASGGTLAVNTSNTRALVGIDPTPAPAFGSVTGLAFSPRGTVYLASSTSAYEFDPTSWTRIAGSPRLDIAASDLASCTGPGSVTVQKNVVGRAAAADQFQLSLSDASGAVGTAVTTGAATGRQSAQVGPFPVQVGTTLTVSETMAAGSTSTIGAYTIRVECSSDGIRITSASSASADVTMPERFGASVVCTFFNSPSPVATVTLTARVLDPATGQTTPVAGWSLGTAAAATAGTATALPSEAPRQNSDPSGNAVWSVLFGSAASRATLTISEVLQTRFTFVSGACTVNGTAVAVTFTTAGGVVSGTLPNVAPSAIVACTLITQPVTSLTLVKSVSFGAAAATDWTLTAAASTGSLPGPTGRTGTAATTNVPVSPGRAYRLSEAGTTATYLQVGAWRCIESTGTVVAVSTAGDVTLRTGAAVTCTVTNATATLTVLKDVLTPSTGFVPATWTVTATPAVLAGASLPTQSRVGAAYDAVGGNAASTFEVRPGHGYTLSEAPTVAGTRLAYQTLRLERLDGATWTTVASRSITAPAAGQSAVYRFVNAPVTGPALPMTGGLGADTFLLSGGLLLALTVGGAVIHRRRKGGSLPL